MARTLVESMTEHAPTSFLTASLQLPAERDSARATGAAFLQQVRQTVEETCLRHAPMRECDRLLRVEANWREDIFSR